MTLKTICGAVRCPEFIRDTEIDPLILYRQAVRSCIHAYIKIEIYVCVHTDRLLLPYNTYVYIDIHTWILFISVETDVMKLVDEFPVALAKDTRS